MNKQYVIFGILVGLIVLGCGCIEDVGEVEYVDDGYRPARSNIPEPVMYSKIWYQCSITTCGYTNEGDFLGCESKTITDTIPYSDHDWFGSISVEEAYDIMFYGILYNRIDTEYDETDYHGDNKAVGELQFRIYGDYGYIKMNIYTTMTRY